MSKFFFSFPVCLSVRSLLECPRHGWDLQVMIQTAGYQQVTEKAEQLFKPKKWSLLNFLPVLRNSCSLCALLEECLRGGGSPVRN